MDIRTIQGRLGVARDGIAGPQTWAAVARLLDERDARGAPSELITATIEHLSREEGRVPHAYQDHLGFWTIGVGRLVDKRKGGRLRDDEIDLLLRKDIDDRIAALRDWPAWLATAGNVARQVALLSMAFQMGTAGLAGFRNSLALCAAGRWAEAADNMMKSAWASQTPERAQRVTAMIRTGKLA